MSGILQTLLGGSAASAAFITEHHYAAGGISQAMSFAGASAGQLAVILVTNSATVPTAPAGWTDLGTYQWTAFGYWDGAYAKVLSAGDISTGSVTLTVATDGTQSIVFYSGVTSAAVVSTGDTGFGPVSTLTIPGFIKSGAKVIIGYCNNRSIAGNATLPTSMNNRIANFASSNFQTRVDDFLPASDYTNSANVVYNATTFNFEGVGRLIELT